MATPTEVIRELTNMHTTIAKTLDDAPTGVAPGFNTALGGTVMPNGKLRYVRTVPIGLVVQAHKAADLTLAASTTYHVDFDTVDYDPHSAITTGASWVFTAPAAGWYRFEPTFTISGDGHAFDHGDFVASYLYKGAGLVGFIDQANWFVDSDSTVSFAVLNGGLTVQMAAGDTVHIKLENNSSHAHKATVGDGGLVLSIFAVA